MDLGMEGSPVFISFFFHFNSLTFLYSLRFFSNSFQRLHLFFPTSMPTSSFFFLFFLNPKWFPKHKLWELIPAEFPVPSNNFIWHNPNHTTVRGIGEFVFRVPRCLFDFPWMVFFCLAGPHMFIQLFVMPKLRAIKGQWDSRERW